MRKFGKSTVLVSALGLLGLAGCGTTVQDLGGCALISSTSGGPQTMGVPGVAYLAVAPNSPIGASAPSSSQRVLAFQLFAKDGAGCASPDATSLNFTVNPTGFDLEGREYAVTDKDGKVLAKGKIVGGKIAAVLTSFIGLSGSARPYLYLVLDTSAATTGAKLKITTNSVGYEVGGQPFTSYEGLPFTSGDLSY